MTVLAAIAEERAAIAQEIAELQERLVVLDSMEALCRGTNPARTSARPTRRARSSGSGRRRGRPPGAVRQGVLAAIQPDRDVHVDEIRTALKTQGVDCSADNLHQQLRRLVGGGLLERVERGKYRRVPS